MILKLSLCAAAALCGAAPATAQWSGGAGAASGSLATLVGTSPVNDAKGDAQNALGQGPPLLDIDSIDVRYRSQTLDFSITFFTDIAESGSGEPNEVVGVLELDVDQNSATGGAPLQNGFSPPFQSVDFGVDYSLTLFDIFDQPGTLAIIGPNQDPVGYIRATFTSRSISGTIPLQLLGNDDGRVNFTSIIGTIPQPTDALSVIGTSVPEPGALTLVALAAALAGRRVRGAFRTR